MGRKFYSLYFFTSTDKSYKGKQKNESARHQIVPKEDNKDDNHMLRMQKNKK